MRINNLVLHNFGVYAGTNSFEFHGKKPVVLIGGMNGRGKTTFLEAVLLSLYGANSFAYSESKYKTYGQYLKSFVNISDGTLETYVDLEFTLDSDSYHVHRDWSGMKQRVSENIVVYKNDLFSRFLTDNWTMFIENILPSGLSSFFFFDGEKIAELAEEDTSKHMMDSIKQLLGISVLNVLQSDLGRIINRTTKNKVADSELVSLEKLRDKKDKAVEACERAENELLALDSLKNKLSQELEVKRQEYSAKGGDIVTQQRELFEKRTIAVTQIEAFREQLLLDAASELPFNLVKSLLRSIRNNAEVEQEQRMLEASIERMRALLPEFKTHYSDDAEAVARFIDYVGTKTCFISEIEQYNMSDISLYRLKALFEGQLANITKQTLERQNDVHKLQAEVDQLDSYMSVDIDEKAITSIYRQIKELEQKIIETDVLIEKKAEEKRTASGEVMVASSEFNKKVEEYLKRVELNDDSDRIIRYAHMANKILDEYVVRLQKNKIGIVAETITKCYKKLANKKNLIERVEMDPVTLDLHYYNADGRMVDKASLSAGEKQLMVISFLWALALCSKKKLPVIIDTPLSRMDSAHRVSLIQTYFPNASDQTIILSTDTEIDRNYYNYMKDDVGDEFTLIYDDANKSTTIKRGYFVEEIK